MKAGAHVVSVEQLNAFRTETVRFIEKGTAALDGLSSEVKRTKQWLEQDRKPFWQLEVKKRQRRLEQTQQELYQVKIGARGHNPILQQQLVRRAESALNEAQQRLAATERWIRNIDTAAARPLKGVEEVRSFVGHTMLEGLHFLRQACDALDAYFKTRGGHSIPAASSSPATPASES